MPLPIIIMLERHWDALAKEALKNALPFLVEKGYDTLCFESPSDETDEEIFTSFRETVDFTKARLSEAMDLLKKRNIRVDLTEMSYSESANLLKLFVSSKYSNEMALWFRELPGNQMKIDLTAVATDLKMRILGVDITKTEMESLRSIEATSSLQRRVFEIGRLDNQRIASFEKNLLKLQESRQGVIFVVGQSHFEELAKAFSTKKSLSDVIFIHPHSIKTLEHGHEDRVLPHFSLRKEIELIDKPISTPDDINEFIHALHKAIVNYIDGLKLTEQTQNSKTLSEQTGLLFQPALSDSLHVDAYCSLEKNEDIAPVRSKLEHVGINGYYTFFRGAPAFCIPCINSEKTGSAISKLGKLK